MKAIIYTGLSVSFDEAKEILDENVIYKPPIKRGDIGDALKENPDIIGIIDGVFHQSPAVAHKEILNAIDAGVKVIGSSSMGALRASELDVLGMVGIGYVYEQYRDGEITSDDDVAVMLDQETLEPLSVPLVNMKYVFTKAQEENVIIANEKEELLQIAKEIFYPKRIYSAVLNESSLNDDKKNKLIDFIAISKDIKKEDGKKLIKYVKELMETA
ncbi:MAG: TfuA-related McrA-glycine thioamidation protein [Methanobrevibacter sp.]|uniref:TfuA-related McrA-glycine thioamidation protein n=1 Tax=Methanobrevibacter sp. TaxID=66852 RepID=UPI0026DFA104|nr:TfuA-related McrA-glycine thioamidation protein [Methanobrevibacter sp.]MDO5848943.1 TfuA-related McrA-glycine thioamidation protein [Methanobrevibacter sp.]